MIYNPRDYGAIGDGLAIDTIAIQQAIDLCSQNGGGRVLLEQGCFRTGTLYLKDDVELFVDITAILLGSTNPEDYAKDTGCQLYRNETVMDRCLIFARNASNILITGRGIIDGNGGTFIGSAENSELIRPMLLRFLECENIRLTNIRLHNPASWTTDFLFCRNIVADQLEICSRANWNGDGLDFNGCENVIVSNCRFDCSDDCICLQNSEENLVCKNIVVTNCIFCSYWAGMRIGLLSCGPIENLTVNNCIFREIQCSAVKIQASEGAQISRLAFCNLVMERVQRPFMITQNRFRERIERSDEILNEGKVCNIIFQNVICDSTGVADPGKSCAVIDAEDSGAVEDIRLSDFHLTVDGGQLNRDSVNPVPVITGQRAECFVYKGQLPASGLFVRNAKSIKLHRFEVLTVLDDERLMISSLNSEIDVI